MSDYERPPDLMDEPEIDIDSNPFDTPRKPVTQTLYWATLSRLTDDGIRVALQSHNCETEPKLRMWLLENSLEGDIEYLAKTEIRGSTQYTTPLNPPPQSAPDPQRLNDLISRAREALTEGRERKRASSSAPQHMAAPSTAVTESPEERARVMAMIEATRQQRAAETRPTGAEAERMLTYDEVYDKNGNVRPQYQAEVDQMRNATRHVGRGQPHQTQEEQRGNQE